METQFVGASLFSHRPESEVMLDLIACFTHLVPERPLLLLEDWIVNVVTANAVFIRPADSGVMHHHFGNQTRWALGSDCAHGVRL